MDPFERYHVNLLLNREPLTANGNNFGEWFHAVRVVLRNINKEHTLDPAYPDEEHHGPHRNCDECTVKELMYTCIDQELRDRFPNLRPFRLMEELKALFIRQVRIERFRLTKELI